MNELGRIEATSREGSFPRLETLSELNAAVDAGRVVDVVRRDEARYAQRIARVAERVATSVPAPRLVLLAGPSSAGKTTTAIRLCEELAMNGVTPLRLSTDDYFVGDAFNPRKPDGTFDYECVDCVDRARLTEHLLALFAGDRVRLGRFDFVNHRAGTSDVETVLPGNGVVVIEGIHALNPVLTAGIPDNLKFRVYAGIFTRLEPDLGGWYSEHDLRLMRRIVRDCQFRGMPVEETFRLWPDVRAGEAKWINPFRGLSDAVFNTALDYELAVIKPFVMPHLRKIEDESIAFDNAQRLIRVLETVHEAPQDVVPGDSILRETIGGSSLEY